jgi:hypothetical protein
VGGEKWNERRRTDRCRRREKTGKFAVHLGAPILSLFCYLHFTHLRERERERVKERDRE